MQSTQNPQVAAAVSKTTDFERYSVRQRLMSASLSLAMTGSAGASAALANTSSPAFVPTTLANTSAHNSFAQSAAASPFASHVNNSAALQHATSVTALTNTGVATHTTSGFATAASSHHMTAVNMSGLVTAQAASAALHKVAGNVNGATDLNLGSASSIFTAGGLAGFHDITIVVGGRQETVSVDTKLTAAELVAAQQVLSGQKQAITINSSGVATGGSFDLNTSTVADLGSAVKGQIGALVVSHGVRAYDSLSNLDLTGSLINMGSIVLTNDGVKGQNDTITAANIFNGLGGSIASSVVAALAPAGISLTTPGMFYNSGTVSSSGNLNITAASITNGADSTAGIVHATPTITATQNVNLQTAALVNTGVISSTKGDVNIVNGGGNANIAVDNSGGVIQASKGNINFNAAGYEGSGNITLNGGDYLSKQVNFNAGTGAIEADIDEVTGQINGTAGSSHITASTDNMNLGNICVNGDPTYFNTNGDITITGAMTGSPDLAIVASGNIIANGGSIDTSAKTQGGAAVNGGNIALIAGAEFTTTPLGASSPGDDTVTLNMTGAASKTGGYIDLSGITLTGSTTNKHITAFTSAGTTGTGGDITLVAYSGTGKNSGGIIASQNGTDSGGTFVGPTLTGGTKNGNFSMYGNGAFLYSVGVVNANTVTASAGTVKAGNYTITDGTLSTNPFTVPTNDSNTTVLIPFITNATGNINLASKGTVEIQNANTTGNLNIVGGGLVDIAGIAHVANATITTPGTVAIAVLNTAGAGGASNSVTGNGGAGGSGGNISITGGVINASLIDASGGGGAGGSTIVASGNTGSGGAGGNGGNITLESTTGNINLGYYINASGGGGGGGAGATQGLTNAGAGGAGGKAGIVTINAKGAYVAGQVFGYSVLDFDGGAGGAGGSSTGSTVAGGGGGGGTGFGGGGGGGAAGLGASGAVGGGGAGTFVVGAGGGGAGYTSAGSGSATYALGGGGGSAVGSTSNFFGVAGAAGVGIGTGSVSGTAGQIIFNNGTGLVYLLNGGTGGGYSSATGSTTGGAGGGANSGGSGGGNGLTTAKGAGATGSTTTTLNGNGIINFTVGAASGSATKPILLDTAHYVLTGTTKSASMYLSCGGDTCVINSATMVSGSTLNVSETHNQLFVAGPITGASNVVLTGWGGVINNATITADKSVTEIAGQAAISGVFSGLGGNITGAGVITAPTVSLTAQYVNLAGGSITAEVAGATTINATSGGPTVALTVDTTTGKTVTLANTSAASSTYTLNVYGTGILVGSKTISAGNLTINDNGAFIGTSAKPLATNVATAMVVNAKGSIANPIYIKDASTGALTLSGTASGGQSLNLVTAAKTLTVNNLSYSNININDTSTAALSTVVLGGISASKIGDGTGVVVVNTASANIAAGATGSTVNGAVVTLTSKTGSIGSTGSEITVSAPVLTVNANKGATVDVIDTQAAVLNAGSSTSYYKIVDDAGLTVNGVISSDTITLRDSGTGTITLNANIGGTGTSTVNITADGGLQQKTKTAITGGLINLNGDLEDFGTASAPILTKASYGIIVNATSGQSTFISQNGKAILGNSTVGNLTLIDSAALTVNDTVAADNLTITAPSVAFATINGNPASVTATNLTITAPVVTISADSGIVANSASFLAKGALSISGSDSTISVHNVLTIGSGAGTTSITLGDAKTGAGDPLAKTFSVGTANDVIVNTAGNFTSSLANIYAGSYSGNPGQVNITAKGLVNVGGTVGVGQPITIKVGASATTQGTIQLNIVGTQSVALTNGASPSTASALFTLDNSGVGATGGAISVGVNGALSAEDSGLITAGGTLYLGGAKSLAVLADLTGNKYDSVSLSSGSTKAFTIGSLASGSVNGTATTIASPLVSITSAGAISANAANSINFSNALNLYNSSGVLIVTGSNGAIAGSAGSAVNLQGKSGITLGDAKTGANNPIFNLDTGHYSSIGINAGKGNFTSPYSTFEIQPNGGGGLSISAANVVVSSTNGVVANPLIHLIAGDGSPNPGAVTLNLTGTTNVVLGNTAAAKGAVYEISDVGQGGTGSVTVSTGGALTLQEGGIALANHGKIALSGAKGLSVTDASFFTFIDPSTVTLSSGATSALLIGGTGANAIAGDVVGGSVTINAASGITVMSGHTLQVDGNDGLGKLTLNTKAFTNSGTVTGLTTSEIDFGSVGKSDGLTISTSTGGLYNGFSKSNIVANGSVNLNNTFSKAGPLNSLSYVTITTPGTLTFGPSTAVGGVSGIQIAKDGILQLKVGALATKDTGPITLIGSGNSQILINSKSGYTVGTAKGNVQIVEDASANSYLTLQSTGGAIVVNSPLSAYSVALVGTSVTLNQNVTGSFQAALYSTSASGNIVTNNATLTTGELLIGNANTKLSKAPVSVNASSIYAGSFPYGGLAPTAGALNIANTSSSVEILGAGVSSFNLVATGNAKIDQLTVTNGNAMVSAGGSLAVDAAGPLSVTNGNLTLISGGASSTLTIGASAQLKATNGSIIIENNSTNNAGAIKINDNATIYASGTKAGVGQVSIVYGAVPAANQLAPGVAPTVSPPTVIQSGGARVTYGTLTNPNGTIFVGTGDTLNAAGRNIVFSNSNGTSGGAITLGLNVTITADPPVGATSAAPTNSGVYALSSGATAGVTAAPTVQVSAPSVVPTSASAAILNNAYSTAGIANLAAINAGRTAVNAEMVAPAATDGKALTGGVSNTVQRNLSSGPMFIAPDVDTTVQTGLGAVNVAAGSVALVIAFDGGVAVYNFHDNKRNSVTVSGAGHNLAVGPGRSAVLTNRNVSYFEEVNPAAFVGYRRVKGQGYADGIKTFQSEFDVRTLMHGVEPLRKLLSAEDAQSRKVSRALLKTTAILLTLGDATPFERMVAPQVTAMNNVSGAGH